MRRLLRAKHKRIMLMRDYYTAFADFLQQQNVAALQPWLACAPEQVRRLLVYRNSSLKSCTQALIANFPISYALLTQDGFLPLASAFVLQCRPVNTGLAWYGQDFADWLACKPIAKLYPWLPDLAKLERAWLNSVLALDAEPITPEQLMLKADAGVSLETLSLGLHPSAQLFQVEHDVWPVWLAAREQPQQRQQVEVQAARLNLLLWRDPSFNIRCQLVYPAEYVFLTMLLKPEMSLDLACSAATRVDKNLDISHWFAFLLGSGLLIPANSEE